MPLARLHHWVFGIFFEFLCLVIAVVGFLGEPPHDSNRLRRCGAKAQIDAFLDALELYKKDVGEFPNSLEGLRSNPAVPGWAGPYLPRDIPPDPWGRPYAYRARADGSPEIVSFGADGKPGGDGPNLDISSLQRWNPEPGTWHYVAARVVQVLLTLLAIVGLFGYPFWVIRRVEKIGVTR